VETPRELLVKGRKGRRPGENVRKQMELPTEKAPQTVGKKELEGREVQLERAKKRTTSGLVQSSSKFEKEKGSPS